ncbi:hypothetical protein KAJ61_03120 [Candidatus Parcubacteria bacterium]|nr:hypothetical protein [Candidatus Parcubacteria bacterium]
MTITTKYICPNITIDVGLVGLKKFYVYNYKGVHYRVFNSLINLRDFIASGYESCVFECETEDELEEYLCCEKK